MLRIHKSTSKKLPIVIGASICGAGALFGLYGLTYTPELSRADSATYPELKPDLSTIDYMQDITPEICANTPEADNLGNNQYQLKDLRDQKIYWVAKMKDGNCWMTQNLDYDLKTTKPLTSADSDVIKSWTPTEDTQITATPNFDITNNNVKSWDPAQGKVATYCTYGRCNDISTISSNDGHDAQGNYYTWGAVTAGQAASLTSNTAGQQATQSICPRGWKMPLSGRSKSNELWDNNMSFAYLFESYGWVWDKSYFANNLDGGTQYIITRSPFYFVYGGSAYSTMTPNGNSGAYWSSVANGSNSVFALVFTPPTYPAQSVGRQYGYPVRCVAHGEESKNVEIVINNTISLDVASEVEVKKGESNPSTAGLEIKVASSQPYNVSVSSSDPVLRSNAISTTIPSKSGLLNTNENAWGVKLSSSNNYSQITSIPTAFYTASGAETKTIPFTIGISTAPDLPNGEYSTDITITATQN